MKGAYVIGSMVGAGLLALVVVLMVTNDDKQARRIVTILTYAAFLVPILVIVAVALSST